MASTPSVVDPYAITDASIQPPPKSLWAALAKIGPGIILAGSIIGSGELILTTSLGAEYGFVFLVADPLQLRHQGLRADRAGPLRHLLGQADADGPRRAARPALGAHWLVWWWFIMLLATCFSSARWPAASARR